MPEVIKSILDRAGLELKGLEMKFGLLSGTLMPDAWRKKLEEFPDKMTKMYYAMYSLDLAGKNSRFVK